MSAAAGAPLPGTESVAELCPVVNPDMAARRLVLGGRPSWIVRAPLAERYMRLHPRLYALLGLLDGRRSVAEAVAMMPAAAADAPQDVELVQGVANLISQGVLRVPGRRLPPRPPPSGPLHALRGLTYKRFDLGDLGRLLGVFRPALGWLFTSWGFMIWLALAGTATALWFIRAPDVLESMRGLSEFGALDAVQAFVVFTLIKVLHEAGHAVAAQRMAAAEGERLNVFRSGISLMFMMPAPYVDVSGMWMVASPWRRALVGAAGIYVEGLIAAIAAILWAYAAPGWGREILFQTVLVVGVSSLLFNANPLVRLDGYYVMSDLLGIHNLQQRGRLAARDIALRVLGQGPAEAWQSWRPALWFVGSSLYRWTIYLGVIWIAYGLHFVLGAGAVLLILLLFVVIPTVQMSLALREKPRVATIVATLLLGIGAAACLIPIPDRIVVAGTLEREGARQIFAGVDGMVTEVAPAGPLAAGETLITLRNPDALRTLQHLELEARTLDLERRRATVENPGLLDGIEARDAANRRQQQELRAEIARWQVVTAQPAFWEPSKALGLRGAWVRRDDRDPLGVLVPLAAPAVIRLVLDQQTGASVLNAVTDGTELPIREWGGTVATFTARVASARPEARDELPSAALSQEAGGPIATRAGPRGQPVPVERIFELRAFAQSDVAALHGSRVQALVALPPSPLVTQLWRAGQRALHRRLAI
nr:hypothetical protein [uncultured Roseococcus sp.]